MTCQHSNCDGELVQLPNDPALPEHVALLECAECGEVYEHDTHDGTVEVDA